jgi:hypothetical protein
MPPKSTPKAVHVCVCEIRFAAQGILFISSQVVNPASPPPPESERWPCRSRPTDRERRAESVLAFETEQRRRRLPFSLSACLPAKLATNKYILGPPDAAAAILAAHFAGIRPSPSAFQHFAPIFIVHLALV